MNSFYEQLKDRSKKRVALLVDPDGYDSKSLEELIGFINLIRPISYWWVEAFFSNPLRSPSPP